MAVLKMAQHNNANINNIVSKQQQLVKPMFHDFLGIKNNNPIDSNVLYAPNLHVTSSSSSLSSTTVSRGGATSDLASGESVPPPICFKTRSFPLPRTPHLLHFRGTGLDFSLEATLVYLWFLLLVPVFIIHLFCVCFVLYPQFLS